jgi:hypothetical protein
MSLGNDLHRMSRAPEESPRHRLDRAVDRRVA